MTMLMIGVKLFIELKKTEPIILLVSMSTQSWQFCWLPPRVLFSPVCCKQDKTGRIKEASQTNEREKPHWTSIPNAV